MIEKEKCSESISAGLAKASQWRAKLSNQYPDHRNARSAKLLAKLSGESASLSNEYWELLRPHFNSARWNECVRQANRQVGFAFRKMSLTFYIRNLIGILSEPPATA
jgi:hypothetical protein